MTETSIAILYKEIVSDKPTSFLAKNEEGKLYHINLERSQAIENLDHDYKKKKDAIELRSRIAAKELQWFDTLVALSKVPEGQEASNIVLIKKEAEITSKLNITNVHHSSTLKYWMKYLSQDELICILCPIFKRFISKMKQKENLTEGEIITICTKLVVNCPNSRVAEWIYILNCAATGKYETNQYKIDEAEFQNWITQFAKETAEYQETEHSRTKPASSNAGFIDDSQEKREKYKQTVKMQEEVRNEVKQDIQNKKNFEREIRS